MDLFKNYYLTNVANNERILTSLNSIRIIQSERQKNYNEDYI